MSKRNWRKEKSARKKRTIEIIEKISREMNGRCIKLIKKVRSIRSYDDEECPNICFEKFFESCEYKVKSSETKERTETITVLSKGIKTTDETTNNEINAKVEENDLSTKSKEKITTIKEEDSILVHLDKKKHLRLDDDEFPKDNCFYANPDKIEFNVTFA